MGNMLHKIAEEMYNTNRTKYLRKVLYWLIIWYLNNLIEYKLII